MAGDAGGERRYAAVARPWRAAVDLSSPAPARTYLALIGHTLRFGMPARRRPAPLWLLASRTGIPERALARALRMAPSGPRADLDAFALEVRDGWAALRERSPRLPADPGRLSLLSMERRSARTVFVFGDGRPLLVAKVPAPGDERADLEARALEEAAAAAAARYLGRLGEARVQEAIGGQPLRLPAVTRRRARRLQWPAELDMLADAFTRLAETTRKQRRDDDFRWPVETALERGALDAASRSRLEAAYDALSGLPVAVLRHDDASAQNCHFDGARLCGIVDWEMAVPVGMPGFDILNTGIAYLEQGVGLTRWSQDAVSAAFEAAWTGPFGHSLRRQAVRTAAAGSLPEAVHEHLLPAFLGWRLGHRIENPERYPTTASTAARMLQVACRS